jgi:hypothetical protein
MCELCPARYWYECPCKPQLEMIVNNEDGFTLYPGIGMFRAGGELMSLNKCLIRVSRETGVHHWQALINAPPATRISQREVKTHLHAPGCCPTWGFRNMLTSFTDELGIPCVLIWSVGNVRAGQAKGKRVLISPELRRIQRAVRKFLQHRRWLRQAQRVFTRCMCNSCLSPDLVQHICREFVK